ncbi:MAG: NAD(P)/FAD-dependent oxidoreductase [Terriglobales bacterium]
MAMTPDAGRPWDLAVVGGGPGGAMTAWRAARLGLRVVVLEQGKFPRDKVCGEFVSAEALELLAEAAPSAVAEAPAIAAVAWVTRSGRRGDFALPAPGRAISRWRLDAALWAAAGACGAERRGGARAKAWHSENGANGRLEYETPDGRPAELRARALVMAAGRWWRMEGLGGGAAGARPGAAWVGLKAHIRGVQAPSLEMFALDNGYCGLAPMEGGEVNVCALVRSPPQELAGCRDLTHWLGVHSAPLGERLHGAAMAWPPQVTAPVFLGGPRRRSPRVFWVGDAGEFADPFTGSGLARAMLAGALAAEIAAAELAADGDLSRAAARHAAAARAATRQARRWSGGLRRWLTAPPAWQNAAAAALAHGPLGRELAARTRWDAAAARRR